MLSRFPKPRVLVTTFPFAEKNRLPREMLEKAGVEFTTNPYGRKFKEKELAEIIEDYDIIIAGTEPITANVIARAKNLQFISRVGIGLDSVNLYAVKQRGIQISYTPDAPAPAVAEMTLGFMLTLLRRVNISNLEIHSGCWTRYFGKRLAECTVGIIGVGRIGQKVIKHLRGFNPKKVLVNDLHRQNLDAEEFPVVWSDKETIYEEAEVISLHVPLTRITKNMIVREHLLSMKSDAVIINTSRGGIINETDLYDVLKQGHLSGAAIDVFEIEPYAGRLIELDNCLLTSHMGSMALDCRARMELEATTEAIRFIENQPQQSAVPVEEFLVQHGVEGLEKY